MKQPWNPPPDVVDVPLVHVMDELYKYWYQIGKKIHKRDHFGIHAKVEKMILDVFELAVNAAFGSRVEKIAHLSVMRGKTEVVKHLVRTMHELHIINQQRYIKTEAFLVEISKMTNGWLKDAKEKEGRSPLSQNF